LFQTGPDVYADPDHSLTGQRLRAIGKTASGRWILVAFTFRQIGLDTLVRPISARYMHAKEVRYYERR
jgi:hypothetical protein